MSEKAKPKPKQSTPEIELEPDAWERFERFIKKAAKGGPQHRHSGSTKKGEHGKTPK
jgi:hypothetical protein